MLPRKLLHKMELVKVILIYMVHLLKVHTITGISWEEIRCSSDPQPAVLDGTQPLNKFPWLGVVQHNFEVGGILRFAVTSAVLIHPAYGIAPAEDIAKIDKETISNTTKLILWHSATLKYAIMVIDYILHPEFTEGRTSATIAVVELTTYGETGIGSNSKPVLPICIPLKGVASFTHFYAARMSDENKDLQKELYKLDFVDEQTCAKYYKDHGLNYAKMAPAFPTCGKVANATLPCVWDAGTALISKQTFGYWTLAGFGVRGAGCGAPARYLSIYDYLPWINDVVTPQPQDADIPLTRLGVRSLSPYKILLYDATRQMNPETGQCRRDRGSVQYKDYFEITTTKTYAYGFFFVAVSQVASFTCVILKMEDMNMRSNTGIWIEHNCHRDPMGLVPKNRQELWYNRMILPPARTNCFMYFKSTAFVEFRFAFSFMATFDMTLYGTTDEKLLAVDPSVFSTSTYSWWPTDTTLNWWYWWPKHQYYL